MKFKLGGAKSPSSSGKETTGNRPGRSEADSMPRSPSSSASSFSTRSAPVRSMEEVSTTVSKPPAVQRLASAGADGVTPSPRSGRPVSLELDTDRERISLAFQVPETPPRGSSLGKKFLETTKFMLDSPGKAEGGSTAQHKTGAAVLPFPSAEDEDGRHVICQDSLTPWTYLLGIPGKNIRDSLIDAFNDWLKCAPANLAIIKQVVGYLHTGSLIIDDIEDESAFRRGEPAAHMVFGVARALNAGNYVYFLAMEKVLKLQSTECLEIFTSEMLNLHRGQGRDIFWRDTSYFASEEEYCHMVCDKTGGLFRLSVRFLQALSPLVESQLERLAVRDRQATSHSSVDEEGNSTLRRTTSASVFTATSDFTKLADQMACYFQIRDDLINLASPKFHVKKGFCEDITEGKLSFIALHSLRKYRDQGKRSEMDELLQILKSKTEDKAKIKRALTLMNNTSSFDYTVKYLRELYKDIEVSIDQLGRNRRLTDLLKTFASELDDCYDVQKRVIDSA